jgi:hypothetical protein
MMMHGLRRPHCEFYYSRIRAIMTFIHNRTTSKSKSFAARSQLRDCMYDTMQEIMIMRPRPRCSHHRLHVFAIAPSIDRGSRRSYAAAVTSNRQRQDIRDSGPRRKPIPPSIN